MPRTLRVLEQLIKKEITDIQTPQEELAPYRESSTGVVRRVEGCPLRYTSGMLRDLMRCWWRVLVEVLDGWKVHTV